MGLCLSVCHKWLREQFLHCGLRKFRHSKSSVYRWYTQLARRRFVFDTYKTMKATRTRHGWVHIFITHRPTLTLQLHNFDLFRTCRKVVSALLHGHWQDFTDTTHRAVPRRQLSFLLEGGGVGGGSMPSWTTHSVFFWKIYHKCLGFREFANCGEWGKFAVSVGHPEAKRLCPWTPLGAPPPDPHYRLALAICVHHTYFDLATPLVVPQYVLTNLTCIYFRPTLCFILVYNCGLTVRNKRICYVMIWPKFI